MEWMHHNFLFLGRRCRGRSATNSQVHALLLAVCFAFAVHHATEIGIESGDLLVDSLQGSS
jgi:hypothetical protein